MASILDIEIPSTWTGNAIEIEYGEFTGNAIALDYFQTSNYFDEPEEPVEAERGKYYWIVIGSIVGFCVGFLLLTTFVIYIFSRSRISYEIYPENGDVVLNDDNNNINNNNNNNIINDNQSGDHSVDV